MKFNKNDLEKYVEKKEASRMINYLNSRLTYTRKIMDIPVLNKTAFTKRMPIKHFDLEQAIKEAYDVIAKNRNARVNIALWTNILNTLKKVENESRIEQN